MGEQRLVWLSSHIAAMRLRRLLLLRQKRSLTGGSSRSRVRRISLDDWRAWWGRHGERELRCILMTAWDPIGVGFEPNAWDEYDDYAFTIARRLYQASDVTTAHEQVAAALDEVEADVGSSGEVAARRTGVSPWRSSPGTSGPSHEAEASRPPTPSRSRFEAAAAGGQGRPE